MLELYRMREEKYKNVSKIPCLAGNLHQRISLAGRHFFFILLHCTILLLHNTMKINQGGEGRGGEGRLGGGAKRRISF